MLSSFKSTSILKHIISLSNGKKISHVVMVKVLTKLLFYCYTQLRPIINGVMCFISLQPELSITPKINGCKGNPHMHRNIIHGKVFFTFFFPHSRVFTTEFREI